MNNDIFTEIRERVSIVDAAQRYGMEVGNNGMARCCFHSPDNNPSMSFKDKGYRCFACGEHGDVIDLVQHLIGVSRPIDAAKSINDMFGLRLVIKDGSAKKDKGKAVFEAEYIYPNGVDKKVKWRYPDGSKNCPWLHIENGKWVKGRSATELYILKNPLPDTVYIVEGEGDVHTLNDINITAVSLPDGVDSKWLPEYGETMRNHTVYIIQDNDTSGKRFAQRIAAELHGCASSVKVFDLTKVYPELPEKGDISDLVKLVGINEALSMLDCLKIETSEYEPAPALQEEHTDAGGEDVNFFDEKKRFLHHVMGDYLLDKLNVCKINDALHIYRDGVYIQGEAILHGNMIELVPGIKDSQRREVYRYLNVSLKTPVKKVSPPHLIPFKTRIYDLKNDAFIEYSPEHVFLNRFPYDYRPDAEKCSIVSDTIAQIAGYDADIIKLIYEGIGNCFYLLNSYRGAVMFYGRDGSNGKSTLLNMISQLLGEDNTSFLSLQDTAERFRLVEVYGKAANIGDDIPSSYIPDSSIIKKLITGEVVMAERKGQDAFPFKPFAKLFFAMNGLPSVNDKSKAFFGRLLLIPLTADFSKVEKRDVSLKDRLWTVEEMEYLTVLAIDGLKRLMAQGDFTRPRAVTEALSAYELENNPILEFLEEHGDVDGQPIPAVFGEYLAWCSRSGHRQPLSRVKFTREVCDTTGLVSESKYHRYYGGKTGRCFAKDES